MKKSRLFLPLAFMLAFSGSAAAESYIGLNAGYRVDNLDWNIAGNTSGSNPNVLSELTWDDLEVYHLKLHGRRDINPRLYFRGYFDYGWITDGENQDSDYSGDNRSNETSRSNNAADDGNVMDISAGIGFNHNILPSEKVVMTPIVGLSFHRQELTITNGFQTIPPTGGFAGLDSTYDANWFGPWAGVDLSYMAGGFRLFGSAEAHLAYYYAEANWNLRTDFAHPKSFEHRAWGGGGVFTIGAEYAVTENLSVNADVQYQKWVTAEGTDETFFATGTSSETQLNEVNWNSLGASVGVKYMF